MIETYLSGYELVLNHILLERNVNTPCDQCHGLGTYTYGDTSTWRRSVGGQAPTVAVCDMCWGSGDKDNVWPSHKLFYKMTSGIEK